MKSKCIDCDRRTATCHADCEDYKAWRAWLDEVNKKKNDSDRCRDLSPELLKRHYKNLRWK